MTKFAFRRFKHSKRTVSHFHNFDDIPQHFSFSSDFLSNQMLSRIKTDVEAVAEISHLFTLLLFYIEDGKRFR